MKKLTLIRLHLVLTVIALGSSIFLLACPNPTASLPKNPALKLNTINNSPNKNFIAYVYFIIKAYYLNINNKYASVSGKMLIEHAKEGIDDYFKNPKKSPSDKSPSYVPVSWDNTQLSKDSDELNINILWQYIQALLKDQTILHLLTEKITNKNLASTDNTVAQKEFMLTLEAVRGMISGLGDRFSSLLDEDTQRQFSLLENNQIAGIGITISKQKNNKGETVFEVSEALKDGTAYRSGIRAGDIILSVDGKKTSTMKMEDILSLLRGVIGTFVTLSLKIPEETQPFILTLKRSIAVLPSIQQGVISAQDILDQHLLTSTQVSGITPIGYIRLLQFDSNTANRVRESLNSQRRQKIHGLILDLRDNGGGLTDQAQEIADLFLEKGETVTFFKRRGQNQLQRLTSAHAAMIDKNMPIVVLINHNTASASEMLLAALQNRSKITLVGNKTYGKGIGQGIYSYLLSNKVGASLITFKLTTFEFLTPTTGTINQIGFQADEIIKYSAAEYKALRTFHLSGELFSFISEHKNSFKKKILPEQDIQNFINESKSKFPGINEKMLELSVWNEVYRIQNNGNISYNLRHDEMLRAAIPYILHPIQNKRIASLNSLRNGFWLTPALKIAHLMN